MIADRVRCAVHDFLPDGADVGRGCIFYADDHEPGPRCQIGDIPARFLTRKEPHE